MQYTGHIPLYYHERDKSSHGFTRHIFDANANYRDYRGCDISAHQSLKTQYLGYDKETMRQIIQNQDETFRYQVQELHRLYRRQRELMDDIKMREIYMRDLQLQTSKSVFPYLSQASHNDSRQFLGCGSVSNIFVLSEEKTSTTSITVKFEEQHRSSHIGHLNSNDSELGSVKTGDSSPCDLVSEKKPKFFIDLNEPLKPESFMSSSTESSCLMETIHHDQHMGCGFDLNTVPRDFPSESEVRHENFFVSEDSEEKLYQQREGISSSEDTVNKKNTDNRAVFMDGISNHDHNFSKAATCIDMNSNVEKELEGPLSPNKKGSSIGEPIQELDRIAAETLIAISSSARYDMHLSYVITDEVLKNSHNSLSWFADIVSSVGDDDDLENMFHDQSKLVSSEMTEDNNGTKIVKRKSLCLSSAARKGTQSGSTRSHTSKRSASKDMNHPKGFKKNEQTSLSDDTRMLKGLREKAATRRNSSANERKHATKFSGSYNVRKSESSALKGLDIRSKQCVLHDWGKIKKRRGGFRRSKFQAINDISNPKAILETTLRNFSCLTTGDSIMVAYNNRKYYIDIVETKPSHAISIIETDCEVDFAPPLDYKEPEKPAVTLPKGKAQAEVEAEAETESKFNPFTGVAKRLDGKPAITQAQPVSATSTMSKGKGTSGGPTSTSSSSSQGTNRQSQGKLVFGSNANRASGTQKETPKETKQEPPNEEEPKFQAFTGKKYSLRG